ncbi:ketopantoate reductase PanE/ApbA C terminal-domain-containing protein [Mycena olivaceomarginata]|nr:ketopantoate reductase PanE/ApbA C terminal-domain-containing protein [Mycena olivaceomarginata]
MQPRSCGVSVASIFVPPSALSSPLMIDVDVLVFGLGAPRKPGLGHHPSNLFVAAGKQVRSVSVVARSNAEVVQAKGLTLGSEKFGVHEGCVYSNREEAAKSGLRFLMVVICANKAILDSNPSLEDMLRPVVGPDAVLVLIQNGIGQEDALREAFPTTTIITSIVWTGTRTVDVGVVEVFTPTDSCSDISRARQQGQIDILASILTKSNASVTVKEDVQPEPLGQSYLSNTLTAPTQLKTRDWIATSPGAREVARRIFSEGVRVAKGKGIAIPDDALETLMIKYTTLEGSSSMLTDSLNEKPMEIEAILGTIMREGNMLGVPVPTLKIIYTLLKAMEWKHAHPDEARQAMIG